MRQALVKVLGCVVDRSAYTLPQKTANAGDIMSSLIAPASHKLCQERDERHTFSLAGLNSSGQFSLFTPTRKVNPWMLAAPEGVAECRVEITITSTAAGWPLHQFSRKISAGWLLEPEISDRTSFWGVSAADCAAGKRVSLGALCHGYGPHFLPMLTHLMVTYGVCHLLTIVK